MNVIIFVAFLVGVIIVGYDGQFEESPASLVAVLVVVVSATPMVFFQRKMKEKRVLLALSVLGVTVGSISLWFLTDGEIMMSDQVDADNPYNPPENP